MTDNTSILGKRVIIGGTEHLRDSDYGEAIVEGVMYVGDLLNKGTADTQAVSGVELAANFLGIAINQVVRQSDTSTVSTVLTIGKIVRFLKPTGGRTLVRAKGMGYDTGATIPKGSPVYSSGVGTTITQNDGQLGKAYIDPAITVLETVIGTLNASVAAPDSSSNSEDVEIEMWY